ncbi:MAG TPA: hypothetical protein VNN76_03290 [Bacteroidota bacterium]|nr:hypothetical protein [Bacteroidota bacterium]
MKHAFRTTAGVFCGYVFMVVLITLVQKTWLGGVGWYESSLDVLALAGFLTAPIGSCWGPPWRAQLHDRLEGCRPYHELACCHRHHTLSIAGGPSGPLWFDILAATCLIAAILLGAEMFLRTFRRAEYQTTVTSAHP